MRTKLVFYGLLLGILSLTGYFALRLFSPDSDQKTAQSFQKEESAGRSRAQRSTPSRPAQTPRQSNSIWTDDSQWDKKLDVDQLKESAEITQAKSLLKELYMLPNKDSFVEKAKELAEHHPEAAEFPAALADYYYNKGDLIQAEAYLKETLKRAPNYTFARNSLADLYVKQGKFEEAKQAYAEVFENGTDNLYAYQGYLGVATMNGEGEKAKNEFIQKYQADPTKTNLALTVADIYFLDEKPAERERILKDAFQRDPYHPILNQVLAQDAMVKGDFDAVFLHGQRAVDNDTDRRRQISMLQTMLDAAKEMNNEQRLATVQQQLQQLRGLN